MIDSKRNEEERKRIMQKYGTRERKPAFDPNTSRYMEYRRKENLRKEMAENPERFIEKKEEPVIEALPQIEPIINPPKKRSWFLNLFKK